MTTTTVPRSLLLASLATACAGRAEPPVVTDHPRPTIDASAGPSRAGGPIALQARPLPADLAVDGDVSEWGLEAGRNAVVIGIDARRVVLAVAWAHPRPPTATVALASSAPRLPAIGWAQIGHGTHELTEEACAVEQIPLVESGWADGAPSSPEVTQACLELLVRHGEAASRYRERFIRRLRIDGGGVSLVDRAGVASLLPGVVVRARESSAEVELPLAVLPDTNQAPLASLWAGASFGELPEALRAPPQAPHPSSEEAPSVDAAWRRLDVAPPVAFGDLPDVARTVFRDPTVVVDGAVMVQLTYSPARPDMVLDASVPEILVRPSAATPSVPGAIGPPRAPDRPALLLREEPLFSPIETLGAVTVGRTRGSLVTVVAGKVVSEISFGRPHATHRRGRALHLFELEPARISTAGHLPPVWRVIAIEPDGTIVEIADDGPDGLGARDAWDDAPKAFNDPDWKRFGMRGKRDGKARSVIWQWREEAARYVVSVVPGP